MCASGWKVWAQRWREAKLLSVGSRSNPSDEKVLSHLVLPLVNLVFHGVAIAIFLLSLFCYYSFLPFPLFCNPQVCERAGVLWPFTGRVQVTDWPLSEPVYVRLDWDSGSNSGRVRPALQPPNLPKLLSGYGRRRLSANACCPCRSDGHCELHWYSSLTGMLTYFITGILSLSFLTFPSVSLDQPYVLNGLAMLGKFGITASFAIIYVYTAEIFPHCDTVRHHCVSVHLQWLFLKHISSLFTQCFTTLG